MKTCRVVFPEEMMMDLRKTSYLWAVKFMVTVIVPDIDGKMMQVSGPFNGPVPQAFLEGLKEISGVKVIEIE